MRIVIDMQGAQTSNSNRGIGRYTLSFTQAMVRNRNEHEVFLALNGLFLDSIEPIRHAFDKLLPQENICVWQMPDSVCSLNSENKWRRQTAELIREAFLANFDPDIVIASSLFEGLDDDAVTSIGALNSNIPTAVILYDLIPLIYPHLYLQNPMVKEWYENKINYLRQANLLLAISESSRLEAINYLDISPYVSVNISTAADSQFEPRQFDTDHQLVVLDRYGLFKPFVMYTGGINQRKNIEGLIRAFAKLPKMVQINYQLAIVCSIDVTSRATLIDLATKVGLEDNTLVLTGFVSEEDLLVLYNLCEVFVFPSLHEGFGLPALEAMSCGRAVIGSNTSSLPEVIGCDDALFNPMDDNSIAEKLLQVLTNKEFRLSLEQHGLKQSKLFSWDTTAKDAINAIEVFHNKSLVDAKEEGSVVHRLKLAYVSPLLPERSGISDYSSELLPELSKYYDIDVIAAQDCVSDSWVSANLTVRSEEWFYEHANHFDRVLYHFGNSHFHQHMFKLLEVIPGAVVLHDFFLSDIIAHLEGSGFLPNFWVESLYQSHGYEALTQRFHALSIAEVIYNYPSNLYVLQRALGVIVHSQYSKWLAREWYGERASDHWFDIPLLRIPASKSDKLQDRYALNLNEDDFVVCSFGFLAPTKHNQKLVDAWLKSSLSKNERCKLFFIGENSGGIYGQELLNTIENSGLRNRIHITGWTDAEVFRQYLNIADVGVQLRTLSRGETSATVLDCMNFGLPTIVNANGSMAELPKDAVVMLPDEFTDADLVNALEVLWQNNELREKLALKAKDFVFTHHNPQVCANQYTQAIESIYHRAASKENSLINAIAALDIPSDKKYLELIAKSIAASFMPEPSQRQFLIDVSNIAQHDPKAGIERVVRAQLLELIRNPPKGYRVEPIYLIEIDGQWQYQYARSYTCRILGIEEAKLFDMPVDISQGDVFYGLDYCPNEVVNAAKAGIYLKWKALGVSINFLVYDLLPILKPEFFPDGVAKTHSMWLKAIVDCSSRLICISNAVAYELRAWLENEKSICCDQLTINAVHLGADISSTAPSTGLPDTSEIVMKAISKAPVFIMVGTVEPRKGYLQVLTAFEQLWEEGYNLNLVIVGREGWKTLQDRQRRTIPQIVTKIRKHRELGSHLFWLEDISDEYLEKVYSLSTCLIVASEGEGFGLPLIEAAKYQLPIIARDIPVFHEVAGDHVHYFSGNDPEVLASSLKTWLTLFERNIAPSSQGLKWQSWKESTELLITAIFEKRIST